MKTYARIQDGIVFEIFSTDGDIATMFHAGLIWIDVTGLTPAPSQGWTYDGHAFAAPVAPPPTPAQILQQKIAAGIVITSTGTPAISATYALDETTLDQIGAVARDSAAGLGLPDNGDTFSYPDIAGDPRTMSAQNVQDLYKVMRNYVFALQTAAAQGGASWPDNTATIP